jgi:predicted O-methyltransferase YrrM
MQTRSKQDLKRELVRRAPWLRQTKAAAKYMLSTARFLSHGVRYAPIVRHLYIDGWLTSSEAIALYEIASDLNAERPVVVELGSWQGKSSMILAKGIRTKRQPVLYCVDPFNATNSGVPYANLVQRASRAQLSLLDTFVQNMKNNGVYHMIRLFQGMSSEFAKSFAEKIDLLFIDADHEYEAVLRDYEEWAPYLTRNGTIAFHDVAKSGSCQGPWRVVKEKIHESAAWADKRLVDSLYIARKAS